VPTACLLPGDSIMPEALAIPEGLLVDGGELPLSLNACLCDLRPRFIPKGQVGQGFRAVARNGRVVLASDVPVTELPGRVAHVRVQTWHKVILAGELARPYGLLLCVRQAGHAKTAAILQTRLVNAVDRNVSADVVLAIDVGGGSVLEFFAATRQADG